MSEFMGLIRGNIGFLPGGASLQGIMTPHGPDYDCYKAESTRLLKPERVSDAALSFMFESYLHLKATPWALKTCEKLQDDYYKTWQGLQSNFQSPELSKP